MTVKSGTAIAPSEIVATSCTLSAFILCPARTVRFGSTFLLWGTSYDRAQASATVGVWGKYAPVCPFNHGTPQIYVEDGDYRGHRELYLKHQHDGVDLDMPYAEKTMQYVEQIWGRPVHLETRQGEKTLVLTCENGKVTKK